MKAGATLEYHTNELANILANILAKNPEYSTPIYLLGDYNNISNKMNMIVDSYRSIVNRN